MEKALYSFYKILFSLCLLLIGHWSWGQTNVLSWDFTGGNVPQVNLPNGVTSLSFNTGGTIGSSGCTSTGYSSNGWNVGEHLQIVMPTNGYDLENISFNVQSSGTGPGNFKISYSSTGSAGTFLDLPNSTFKSGNSKCVNVFFSLSNLTELFNNPNTVIRLIFTGGKADGSSTIGDAAANGTFRIDDLTIQGSPSFKNPEPSEFPTNFNCGSPTSSSISLSWIDAVGTMPPQGYLVQWSTVSYAAITDPVDGTPIANGTNSHSVQQGIQNINVFGLNPATSYFFKIWSYTNSGSKIDYKLIGEPQTACNTLTGTCGGIEPFENIPNNPNPSQYHSRTWSGTGGIWNATNARTDLTLTNKAIATNGNGTIVSPDLTGGIGVLSFDYVKAFTGSDARSIEV